MPTPTSRPAYRLVVATALVFTVVVNCRVDELLQPPAHVPAAPTPLAQLRRDGRTPIAPGGSVEEPAVVFQAIVDDLDPDESLRLEVEVREIETPFSGTATASSVFVPSGDTATVAVAELRDNAAYHWQARAVDATGRAGPWSAFGDNEESAPDFRITLLPIRLVFGQPPTAATAGAPISPAVTVAAQDADGNTLASFAGMVSIALDSNPAGGALGGAASVLAAGGVATFTDLTIERAGTGYTLKAGYGQLGVGSDTFTISPGSVSPAGSTVTVSPATITAGSGTSTVSITARDAYGNRVRGAAVVLAATGTGNTLTQPAGPTDSSGITTGALRSTVAGTKTVTATIAGVTVTQKGTITVRAAAVSASRTTVTVSPAIITAGSATSTITVTARDAFGNPVSGSTVVLAATGTGNTLTQPAATTNASGVATGTLRSTVAGTKTVSATASGVAVTQTATITVKAGAVSASRSTVSASPTIIAVGTGISTITVRARDAFGNAVSGATVVLAATGTGNTLTQPTGTTSATGAATGTLRSTVAGIKTVSAKINGIAVTQTVAVTVN